MRPLARKNANTRGAEYDRRIQSVERRIPPFVGFYEIKVFADANALDGNLPESATDVSVGDGKFIFAIPFDLDGSRLMYVNAFITTVSSSGLVTVQFHNINTGNDLLTTKVTIDQGDKDAENAATPFVIDQSGTPPVNEVSTADQIRVDVDTAGTGAQGLGVMLDFWFVDPL